MNCEQLHVKLPQRTTGSSEFIATIGYVLLLLNFYHVLDLKMNSIYSQLPYLVMGTKLNSNLFISPSAQTQLVTSWRTRYLSQESVENK